ncbi:GTP cyclohydrolase 1 type 2 [Clostridia bacterium]|nr:GTP cyclohydrolase 1 type 2 [Clostridia bacterium]
MPVVDDVIKIMNEYAPENGAEDWDNVGLMVGDFGDMVRGVLVSLDITDEVISEAEERGANLIITHHPLIFKPISKINSTTAKGRRIMLLIKKGINVYSAHTNLDIAEGGTNDTLFSLLGLQDKETLVVNGANIGRIGELPEMTIEDFAKKAEKAVEWNGKSPRLDIVKASKTCRRISLCTGSAAGFDFLTASKNAVCDTYITGDVSYHQAQFAKDNGVNLVVIPHFYSEIHIVKVICGYLSKHFQNISYTKTQTDIFTR